MNYNIVLGIDNQYTPHAMAVLSSLKKNVLSGICNIFILSLGMSTTNKSIITEWGEDNSTQISIIDISIELLKNFPIKQDGSISLATYLRLLIPEVLPQEINKVLYIDSDTLVLSDIIGLYEVDLSNYAVAAIEDVPNDSLVRKALTNPYFNAGVLLLNLSYLRRMDFTKKAIQYIQRNYSILKFHDQDVLNVLLGDKTKILAVKWNLMDCFFQIPPYIQDYRKKELAEALQSPGIIHFSGLIKPWHYGSNHPYTKVYASYQPKSSFDSTNDRWGHFSRIATYQKILLLIKCPRPIYYFIDRLLVKIWKRTHD